MPAWTDIVSGAEAQGLPSFSAPIQGVSTPYLLTQPFANHFESSAAAQASALALNTAHPDLSDYVLVEETEKQHVGGGEYRWNRVYAKVPSQHFEFVSYAYSFIGFLGRVNFDTSTGTVTGTQHRERLSRTVQAKVQYDYFLVDGTTYASILNLPIIDQQRYYIHGNLDVPPFSVDTDYLLNEAGFTEQTTPSVEEYQAMIAADAASATSYSIVAEPSNIQRWRGNIMVRTTKYLKAI